MEYYAIDRIEENYAVCEKDGETMVNISRALLPEGRARAAFCADLRTARSRSTEKRRSAAAKRRSSLRTACLTSNKKYFLSAVK